MSPKRVGIALAAAAQFGVLSAQDPGEPLLIPPAPAPASDAEAGDGPAERVRVPEDAAAEEGRGPLLVPPAPTARAAETVPAADSVPAVEPQVPSDSRGVRGVGDEEPMDRHPAAEGQGVAEEPALGDDGITPERGDGTDRGESDSWSTIRRRQRVPPAAPPRPASFPENAPEVPDRDDREPVRRESTQVMPAGDQEAAPGDGEAPLDEEVRARYRLVGGEWWFQLRSGRWKYYRGGEWQDFDPVTFVPLRSAGATGDARDGSTVGAGRGSYAALRPVYPPERSRDGDPDVSAGEEDESGRDERRDPRAGDGDRALQPPQGYVRRGYLTVPAEAVDPRTGIYYGPGPNEEFEPAPDDRRDGRRRPIQSLFRGIFGRRPGR